MSSEKNLVVDLGERGKFNPNNRLNELTGKEWIKFTKSWFVHKPPRRKNDEIIHPAKFPETLIEEFISFFTKKGDWILDPFMGTGSALIAASRLERNGVGIELSKYFYQGAVSRIKKLDHRSDLKLLQGSSTNLTALLSENDLSKILFDYIVTSPPYWNQLERNSIRQKGRQKKGLATKYSPLKEDLGNESRYDDFLEKQAQVFDQVYRHTKNNGYLTIITNNIYYESKLYPLAFDTAVSLTKRGSCSWTLKDEKIWLQDDKPLIALGINSAWVSNRHHQYCLIFRKEEK